VKLYWRRDVNKTLSSTLEVVLRQVRVPIPQSKILQRKYRKRELCWIELLLILLYKWLYPKVLWSQVFPECSVVT